MSDHILNLAQVGSTFTRAAHGWDVKWVDGGTVLHRQGATISQALVGLVAPPVPEVPEVIPEPITTLPTEPDVTETPKEKKARLKEEKEADKLAAAFVAGTLPEEDRRAGE